MLNFLQPWANHFPVLLVLIPLLGGVLAPIFGRGSRGWAWAVLTTGIATIISIEMLLVVRSGGAISYPLGGWPAPFGIELKVDLLSAIVALVVTSVGWIVTIHSRRSVQVEIPADRLGPFWSVWLLAITGLLGIIVTGDAFNMYVLLEISALTIYGLIAMGRSRDRKALVSAFNYLILGSIGASFILIAIGLLYAHTGTLNMSDLHQRLQASDGGATVMTARAFLLVGLSLKMALFPLHFWMPAAYSTAPSAVASLLSATATKVGIYMAMRLLYTVLPTEGGVLTDPNVWLLGGCAGAAIFYGSIQASRQPSLSLLLAYSSVAQVGYIVLGLAVGHIDAMTGSILHLMFHALMKGGLFLCAGIFIYRLGSNDFTQLAGIGRRMPWTSAAVVLGGLGMIGVPGTAGFISKLHLLRGLLLADHPILAMLVLLGSAMAAIYTWKFVEIAYLKPVAEDAEEIREVPFEMLWPVWLLIGSSIWLGLNPAPVVELATDAARALLGGGG